MPAKVRHFAINADDVPRAKAFYETVFGWSFTPWGPPDFYQTRDAGDRVIGALQARRELEEGLRLTGPEITLGVEDLAATMKSIVAGGGRLLNQPYRIPGVGELIFFKDPEGNVFAAMQYENAWDD